jgi:hypothetical protein
MAVQEQRQLCPAAALLMQAAVARMAKLREALAAQVVAVLAEITILQTAAQAPQIRAAAAAERLILALHTQAALAAPASSFCRTQWPLARPLFSNPQQHGLHRPAQRRWITLS